MSPKLDSDIAASLHDPHLACSQDYRRLAVAGSRPLQASSLGAKLSQGWNSSPLSQDDISRELFLIPPEFAASSVERHLASLAARESRKASLDNPRLKDALSRILPLLLRELR